MSQVDTGCQFDVDRGPDWLFIRIHLPADQSLAALPIAESIWSIIDQNRVLRVVLELDQLSLLHSHLIGQFVMLYKRLHSHGGMLRLCGLSPTNEEALHGCRLDSCFPSFANRGDAVMGHLPRAPR